MKRPEMEIKRKDESRGQQRVIMGERTATLMLAPPACGPSAKKAWKGA